MLNFFLGKNILYMHIIICFEMQICQVIFYVLLLNDGFKYEFYENRNDPVSVIAVVGTELIIIIRHLDPKFFVLILQRLDTSCTHILLSIR